MRNTLIIILCTSILFNTLAPAQTSQELKGAIYEMDQQHALMDFTCRHVGFSKVRGTFNDYRASIYFVEGDLEKSIVSATIEVASLDTGSPGRDDHLKNVFFDVENYPHITFNSNRIEKQEEGYRLFGTLKIKDVEKELELPLDVITINQADQWEHQRMVLETSLTINRNDFNVVYDNEFWDGIVGEEVKIEISFAAYHYNALNNVFPWRKKSIGTFIKNGIPENGLEATLSKVKELHAAESEEYRFGISHFHRAGWAEAQSGAAENGISILETAIDLHKDNGENSDLADLYTSIAELCIQIGQTEKAQMALKSAFELDPLHPSAMVLKRFLKENP